MDQKEILANLGRVKSNYNKGNSVEALDHMVIALKEIVNIPPPQIPTSLRSTLRESIQLISKDSIITEGLSQPIIYKPGEESSLLNIFSDIYKRISSGPQESREEAKARKLRIDKAYSLGLRLLDANKVSEADQVFQEAIKSYRDEMHLFKMIANALINAGQNVRASGYIKKALTIYPDSQEFQEMLAKVKE